MLSPSPLHGEGKHCSSLLSGTVEGGEDVLVSLGSHNLQACSWLMGPPEPPLPAQLLKQLLQER